MNRQYTVEPMSARNGGADEKAYGSFLETYQQFSPLTMACQLTKRRILGQNELEPYCETVFAAVLFADISGFTRLSARLSEEELKFHINQYFSTLLGVVQQNHGDTIKFCGDAVMIMWSVDRAADYDVKAAAVLMASLCALQLLGDCGKYDRGEGNHAVSLRLHCGIGCGEVHCMCVGEGSRWEYLISGDPMRQVGIAEPEAGLGEVCLSPEAHEYIQQKLESEVRPKGSYRLTGALKRGRSSAAVLGLLQEEGSHSGDSIYGHDSADRLRVNTIDDDANLFSRDQFSGKNDMSLDLTGTATKESWLDEFSDDVNFASMKSKRQVNARYVPMGVSIDLSAPSGRSSNSSVSNSLNSGSQKGGSGSGSGPPSAIPSRSVSRSKELLEKDEDDSESPFVADAEAADQGCSCFPRRRPLPAALPPAMASAPPSRPVTAKEDVHSNTFPRSSTAVVNSSPLVRGGSASQGLVHPPGPTQDMVTKKRSFIVDISHRMKQGKESFIFPKRNNSYRELDVDGSRASSDQSLDVPSLKAALALDRDPHVAKARGYLYDMTLSQLSAKNSPIAKTLSTFNSERDLNLTADREEMAKILRRFIHEAALKAIESDLFDFGYLAEKRMVVTMFIEIIGLEHDFNAGEVRRPQRAMAYALACINRFEGSLRQYVVDDKGCVLIAAFGLPGSHHEDNCTRAVETAKAIQKSLEIMQITCRTGIAMGSVYCGLVGSRARCEYAMMGSSVNLAARLMGKCSPGFILVNDTVFQGANQDFEFQTLEPIQAKGYENRVDVYSPSNRVQSRTVGLGNRLNQHCKFVGRTEEKLMFQQDLMNFGYGDFETERTVAHIIEGPPGIGKTSLVAEINEMAKSNANITSIVIASASASHMSSSYFVIRQVLDFVLQLDCFKSHISANSILSSKARRLAAKVPSDSGSAELFRADTPPNLNAEIFRSNNSVSTQTPQTPGSESISYTRAISRSLSRHINSDKDEKPSTSISSKARSIMKLPSAILDKRFLTFSGIDDSPAKDNVVDILLSWIDKIGGEVLISELDPIGVFDGSAIGRANSYNVIYGEDIFGTGGTAGTPFLGRSRSDLSMRDDDEVFEDFERLCFPMKTLLPLLGDILSIEIRENEVTKALTPAMRWRMGDALIVQILRMAIDQEKIVFIVENLQWCDYQSLSVLFYLVRDTMGGLFIGTERPTDNTLVSSKERMRGRYTRMMTSMRRKCSITSLRPLFDAEVQRVMEEVVGRDNIDSYPVLKTEESIQNIVRRTAGLPFAVIALCLALRNAIKQNKFVDINRLSSGAHNIILNRFDQLSNTEKVVLKIASVIGREFDFLLLRQALMDLNYSNCTSALFHTLEQLAGAKLIKISKPEVTGDANDYEEADATRSSVRVPEESDTLRQSEMRTFEFIDQSVQGGIYNLMLEGQREIAHAVIGTLLEEKYHTDDSGDLFAEVVHHFNLSSNLEKKLKYLRMAAKKAEVNRDYKMTIHYNAELIKFSTQLTLDGLIEKCCGRDSSSVKVSRENHAVLHEKISSPQTAVKVAGDLRVVRNIFASRSGNQPRGATGSAGVVAASDGWLVLKKVIKQLVVVEEATRFGITKDDVCRWIAVVADGESRIGMYHWANNLSIVVLGVLNCALLEDNTCIGVIKQKLKLTSYPKFTRPKVQQKALLCYENLAYLQLLRGRPEVALGVLKTATKLFEQNDPAWLPHMEDILCRMNALYSVAYLGLGDAQKAAMLMAAVQVQKRNQQDVYTKSYVSYVKSFHLAAHGSFGSAFDCCKEAIEVFSFIGEAGLAHLITISAGWYAFLLGNLTQAKELYQKVFEYGLSTAYRPLIKMSMELYAAILILSSDFSSANAVLDHLKSPLQTGDASDGSVRPSSIKSSLIAMSCILDKRYVAAIPHIQFSCRVLSTMNPTNPVCGLYLFFAAYSALEVLLNVISLDFQERVTANIVLNEAVTISMKGLERCSLAMPCLRLLYKACEVKRCRLDPSATVSNLIEFDASIDKADGVQDAGSSPVSNTPPVGETVDPSLSYPQSGTASPERKDFLTLLENSLPRGSPLISSPGQRAVRSAWAKIGSVGMYNEFALGKLFFHREREALCRHVGAEKTYIESTCDSSLLYNKLCSLYHRENSVANLSIRSGMFFGGSGSVAGPDDGTDGGDTANFPAVSPLSVASQRHRAANMFGISSIKASDGNPDDDESVYAQLDRLRAYEKLQGLEENEGQPNTPGSMRKYATDLEVGNEIVSNTKPKPRRMFPVSGTAKIIPEADSDANQGGSKHNRRISM